MKILKRATILIVCFSLALTFVLGSFSREVYAAQGDMIYEWKQVTSSTQLMEEAGHWYEYQDQEKAWFPVLITWDNDTYYVGGRQHETTKKNTYYYGQKVSEHFQKDNGSFISVGLQGCAWLYHTGDAQYTGNWTAQKNQTLPSFNFRFSPDSNSSTTSNTCLALTIDNYYVHPKVYTIDRYAKKNYTQHWKNDSHYMINKSFLHFQDDGTGDPGEYDSETVDVQTSGGYRRFNVAFDKKEHYYNTDWFPVFANGLCYFSAGNTTVGLCVNGYNRLYAAIEQTDRLSTMGFKVYVGNPRGGTTVFQSNQRISGADGVMTIATFAYVKSGVVVTIPKGQTLIITGDFINDGIIYVEGNLIVASGGTLRTDYQIFGSTFKKHINTSDIIGAQAALSEYVTASNNYFLPGSIILAENTNATFQVLPDAAVNLTNFAAIVVGKNTTATISGTLIHNGYTFVEGLFRVKSGGFMEIGSTCYFSPQTEYNPGLNKSLQSRTAMQNYLKTLNCWVNPETQFEKAFVVRNGGILDVTDGVTYSKTNASGDTTYRGDVYFNHYTSANNGSTFTSTKIY